MYENGLNHKTMYIVLNHQNNARKRLETVCNQDLVKGRKVKNLRKFRKGKERKKILDIFKQFIETN